MWGLFYHVLEDALATNLPRHLVLNETNLAHPSRRKIELCPPSLPFPTFVTFHLRQYSTDKTLKLALYLSLLMILLP